MGALAQMWRPLPELPVICRHAQAKRHAAHVAAAESAAQTVLLLNGQHAREEVAQRRVEHALAQHAAQRACLGTKLRANLGANGSRRLLLQAAGEHRVGQAQPHPGGVRRADPVRDHADQLEQPLNPLGAARAKCPLEVGVVRQHQRGQPGDVRRGAIGKVVPGYTARVVDDEGHEVPRGTIGKLAVVGPTGCRYLDDARQANYVKDGWNHPGDAFTQDDDDYFFYQARADDMIITSGYNVGGPEVEDALLKHAAVAECGVVGLPDDERGMVVKAFVVLKPGHTGDADMARARQDHVKATLAPFKYPRQVEFVDKLPRTETGKLQRFKLRQP